MTNNQIIEEKSLIDQMDQEAMAYIWRFSPVGHKYFDKRLPLYEYFKARFDRLGGMTAEISKRIG